MIYLSTINYFSIFFFLSTKKKISLDLNLVMLKTFHPFISINFIAKMYIQFYLSTGYKDNISVNCVVLTSDLYLLFFYFKTKKNVELN